RERLFDPGRETLPGEMHRAMDGVQLRVHGEGQRVLLVDVQAEETLRAAQPGATVGQLGGFEMALQGEQAQVAVSVPRWGFGAGGRETRQDSRLNSSQHTWLLSTQALRSAEQRMRGQTRRGFRAQTSHTPTCLPPGVTKRWHKRANSSRATSHSASGLAG